jgi:hypothetical protein
MWWARRQGFSEADAALQLAALEREKLRCADRRDFRAAAALRDQASHSMAFKSISGRPVYDISLGCVHASTFVQNKPWERN